MIASITKRIKKSKHSKTLLKIYLVWCVVADLTLIGGLLWGVVYLWF
jgi:hypothetical protein